MCYLSGNYTDTSSSDIDTLQDYILTCSGDLSFSGNIKRVEGVASNDNFTLLHNRSISEEVNYFTENDKAYNGNLLVQEGKLQTENLTIIGNSLLIGADLTGKAFSRSIFGQYGQYIVAIGLLLFAFSTAIAWSYYGDRAMTYLFGSGSVLYYRIFYVIGFFLAAFTDTQIIWTFSGIAIALMTIPNLIGILWLRKDMKTTVNKYWEDFKKENPSKS